MRGWYGLLLVGLLVSPNVHAQGVPLSDAQRVHIGRSLKDLSLVIERLALVHKDCAQREPQEVCAVEAKQLATLRAQQQGLCQQMNIPARQHGCP